VQCERGRSNLRTWQKSLAEGSGTINFESYLGTKQCSISEIGKYIAVKIPYPEMDWINIIVRRFIQRAYHPMMGATTLSWNALMPIPAETRKRRHTRG
jgi:hypothetical protein